MRVSAFLKLSPRQREAYARAVEAVALMRREGKSLRAAAREAGTTPATVLRYARSALRQDGRTWKARPTDNLIREVRYQTPGGRTETALVQGADEARKVAQWQSAVLHFQRTGDADYLRRLRHKTFVDAHGRRHRLPTDPELIRGWSRLGRIDIEEVDTP